MEMIEGVKGPDSGEIIFFGEPQNQQHLSQMGVQFQLTSLPQNSRQKKLFIILCRYMTAIIHLMRL